MKWALIKNGTVINVIAPCAEGDVHYMDHVTKNFDEVLILKDEVYVGPGFSYDGKSFIMPPEPNPEKESK